jgi:hypothetical protein
MKQGNENRTRGVHYYDLGTTDGLAACGYIPTSPSDPLLTYAMSGASCKKCREAINDYIEGLKTGKWPYALPVASVKLTETTGSC